MNDVIFGAESVMGYAIGDNFRPMTHFSKGDVQVSGYGFYYTIDELNRDSNTRTDPVTGMEFYKSKSIIYGDDLQAVGYGGRFDYALSNRFSVYLAIDWMMMTGGMNGYYYHEYNMFNNPYLASGYNSVNYHIDGTIDMVIYRYGFAWDLWGGDTLSIPIHLGFSKSQTKFALTYQPERKNTDPWINAIVKSKLTALDAGYLLA
jgi:hypothetical protein